MEAKNLLGYTEKHHILPKSFQLGGERDTLNFAYLSAKEHFICHKLLSKMFIGEYNRKMLKAYRAMAILIAPNQQRYKINSKEFDKLRKLSGFTGHKHSLESITLMSINANGFKKGYTPWNKGVPTSNKTKQKQDIGRKKYREKNPNWAEQCREARKIGRVRGLVACSKKTEVDGIIYPSATAAAKAVGLKKITLIKRVGSVNYPTYKYVTV